jgi:hypothetical protein
LQLWVILFYNKQLAQDIQKIAEQTMHLWGLSKMTFDYETNAFLRFTASQQLALVQGTLEDRILKDEEDIDRYFNSSS